MCWCTVCTDGTVAMTSKQSRLTELIRQEALRVVALLCREVLVAKQTETDDEFDHTGTNFVNSDLPVAFSFYCISFKKLALPLLRMLVPESDSSLIRCVQIEH